MTGLRFLLAGAGIAASFGLCAWPAAAERLAEQAVPGFVVGYEDANAQQTIREEVPSGETVQDWTRMVTTQRFPGAASRVSPAAFFETVSSNLARACPGATTSEVVTTTRSGHVAAQMRADCPRLAQTGKPETFIMLIVVGAEDLHVKQVAYRRVPTAGDIRWGEEILAAAALCETGESGRGCRG